MKHLDIDEPIEQEKKVIDLTVELWNEWLKLPRLPDDTNDMMFHIHAIQRILFSMEGIRKHNASCH